MERFNVGCGSDAIHSGFNDEPAQRHFVHRQLALHCGRQFRNLGEYFAAGEEFGGKLGRHQLDSAIHPVKDQSFTRAVLTGQTFHDTTCSDGTVTNSGC